MAELNTKQFQTLHQSSHGSKAWLENYFEHSEIVIYDLQDELGYDTDQEP
jgi:hypothetical protein